VRKRIPLSVPVFYQLLQEGRRHEELWCRRILVDLINGWAFCFTIFFSQSRLYCSLFLLIFLSEEYQTRQGNNRRIQTQGRDSRNSRAVESEEGTKMKSKTSSINVLSLKLTRQWLPFSVLVLLHYYPIVINQDVIKQHWRQQIPICFPFSFLRRQCCFPQRQQWLLLLNYSRQTLFLSCLVGNDDLLGAAETSSTVISVAVTWDVSRYQRSTFINLAEEENRM
jgi:hypothetical protein